MMSNVSGDTVGLDPTRSNPSNMSVASSSRVLPRVEAGDILTSWDEFGN